MAAPKNRKGSVNLNPANRKGQIKEGITPALVYETVGQYSTLLEASEKLNYAQKSMRRLLMEHYGMTPDQVRRKHGTPGHKNHGGVWAKHPEEVYAAFQRFGSNKETAKYLEISPSAVSRALKYIERHDGRPPPPRRKRYDGVLGNGGLREMPKPEPDKLGQALAARGLRYEDADCWRLEARQRPKRARRVSYQLGARIALPRAS